MKETLSSTDYSQMIHFNLYHPKENFYQHFETSTLQTPFAYLEYNLGGRMIFELLKKDTENG